MLSSFGAMLPFAGHEKAEHSADAQRDSDRTVDVGTDRLVGRLRGIDNFVLGAVIRTFG